MPLTLVTLYDQTASAAAVYVAELEPELGVSMRICTTTAATIAHSDIVLIATWVHEPFLHAAMLQPGTHITTLGSERQRSFVMTTSLP